MITMAIIATMIVQIDMVKLISISIILKGQMVTIKDLLRVAMS